VPKLTKDLLLQVLRDARGAPLGVGEILARAELHSGARSAVKRALRELIREHAITGEGKRYALRTDRSQPQARQESNRAPASSPAENRRPPSMPARVPAEVFPSTPARVRAEEFPSPPARVPAEEFPSPPARVPAEEFPSPPAPAGGGGEAERLLRGFRPLAQARGGPKRVVGVLHLKQQGYGFVSPVASVGEDLFLPAEEARGLGDGDLILCEVVTGRGGRWAAKLVSVMERRRTHALGRYERTGRTAVVIPRDPNLLPLHVEPFPQAHDGDEVRVRLPARVQDSAEVEAVVGKAGDPRLESLSVAYEQGFSDQFPEAVSKEAEAFPDQVTPEQWRDRRNLAALPLVTIDGEDARDFDDAVYVEELAGETRLLVAIADVATYVKSGTALDAEALRRCTSVYFPDRVLPMLPERLSNGLCSLMPNVERLCLVADMRIDAAGRTTRTELYPAVMKSAARCTYTQVSDSLAGKAVDLPERVTSRFPAMARLAERLMHMREQRGAIDFNLTEQRIVLGPDGKVADVVPRERNQAHRLIESFMLAANEAVADHFVRSQRAAIFRIHDSPDEEKLENFLKLARAHGFQAPLGQAPRPQSLNAFLARIEGRPEARALNSLLLRSMMQAVYAEKNIGHYGLGAEGYLHFTSPIRRYPDLMVHRLLSLEWLGKPAVEPEDLAAVARRCSERERAAMSAEREIDNFYGALWAADHVGERFMGTIDGATDAGLFVEIDAHMVSGLVAAESLGSSARLARELQRWVLGRTGIALGIGDAIEVEIVSANVARRQIDLRWTAAPAQEPGAKPKPERRKAAASSSKQEKRVPERRAAPSAGAKKPARQGKKDSRRRGRRRR
jgi:ribonuclease R